jgi:hypothetical protein
MTDIAFEAPRARQTTIQLATERSQGFSDRRHS